MSKILGGKAGLLDEGIGGSIERGEGAAQGRRHASRHLFVERLQTGPEYSCVNLGEEECDAPPKRRHGVTELAGDATHQPLSREPASLTKLTTRPKEGGHIGRRRLLEQERRLVVSRGKQASHQYWIFEAFCSK